jgi:hypothetical protein
MGVRRRSSSRARPAAIAVALLALIGAAWWWRLRPPEPRRPSESAAVQALPLPSVIDGLKTAERERDWGRAVENAAEMVRRAPRNSAYLLILAQELNNFAWTGAVYRRERTALRTSLERVGVFDYSFALLDSATALTRDANELAMIRRTRGQLYELVRRSMRSRSIRRKPRARTRPPHHGVWVMNHLGSDDDRRAGDAARSGDSGARARR